jgi:hypothetical protein
MRRYLPGLGLWLCLALCGWIYSPGLAGPFLLDDRINLAGLDVLQDGAGLMPDVVWGNASGPLGRPASMLSFAGSWLAGGGLDPQVFKQHNLALHLLAGSLVCWLAFLLLSALRVPDSEPIAVMTAAVWLLSPLMLSTVLYVIQRMAQLACVFTLLALICFCKARLARGPRQAWVRVGGCALFGCAAIFSKETAVVLLPLLLLLEFAVFRSARPSRAYALVEKSAAVLLGSASVFVLLAVSVGWLADGLLSYAQRDFTLGERVMTQFRVLLDYVAGLLWPLKGGYGLYHDDFQISRGWFSPPATLAAGVAVTVALTLAVMGLLCNRLRVLALGVLFFFVAHAAESTIFPLEIYFEHRNYLPAVGLCLGLSWSVVMFARRLPELRALMIIACTVFVLVSAGATGLRASYWSSVELYSALAVTEHPTSPRANIAYGTALARAGDPALGANYIHAAARLLDDPALVTPLREIWLYCVSGMAPPGSLFKQLDAAMGGFGNTRIDEALDAVVESVLDRRCAPSVGIQLASSILRFRESGGRLTARASGLAVKLENDLGRFPIALRYADDLLERDSRSVVANLMVAYLAARVGNTARRDGAVRQLRLLDCQGLLTLDQQQSLATLTGQPEGDVCDARD